jgi:MYXO-CTERM domain-containing protein
MARLLLSSCLALAAMSVTAFAENKDESLPDSNGPTKTWKGYPVYGTTHQYVAVPDLEPIAAEPQISPYIYLNRCTGGCTITGAAEGQRDDARQNISFIATPGDHVVAEFKNKAGQTGAAADAEWNAIVKCMKEVYSPYGVMLTDTKPVGVSYTMAVIAGTPQEIGYDPMAAGVAPAGCDPQDNVISFSFANYDNAADRTNSICWTAAQETAHAFGLDHEYQFSDGTSACNDPMTYRYDCLGQKFFRNKPAQCGENSARTCRCGGLQNSHIKIRSVFGEGTSLIPAPTCSITNPTSGTVQNGAVITVSSGSQRGVDKSELWLNGYKWAEVPGAKFGINGQPNPSTYSLTFPGNVPDGKIDILVKCYDDLGLEKDSQTITVTKGNCNDAASCKCLEGQQFSDGKCFWEAPVGELGDSCTFPQFCKTGICTETDQGGYCTSDCIIGSTDGCPMNFECIQTGASTGQCLPISEGGCCSATTGGNQLFAQLGLGGLVLGLIARRRRRRKTA